MVRSVQWMAAMVVGLLLAWEGAAATAQQTFKYGEPTPARLRPLPDADVPAYDDADADDEAMTPDDTTDGDALSEDELPRRVRRDNGPPRRSNSAITRDFSRVDSSEREVIKERHSDGKVKVEREVAQDEEGNYHNHGVWKTWDQRGNLVAQGEYNHGHRSGIWIRWFRNTNDVPLFSKAPYSKFNAPFISQAKFENDKLDGFWTIYDGKKNKISQFEFSKGKRNGASIWWHPNGHKMREAHYRDGELHGQMLEWNSDGTLVSKENYQGGRKMAAKVAAKYQDGSKKSEGMYLSPKEVEQTPDDWWNCTLQVTMKQGKDERHGAWTTWYANGQPQLEGNFEHDLQHGQFTWWHANGQKALEGRFDAGKQSGVWTWWYPTGQKSIRGEYARGTPTGRWTWWKENGKVSQSADLSSTEGIVIDPPLSNDLDAVPQAREPKARRMSR